VGICTSRQCTGSMQQGRETLLTRPEAASEALTALRALRHSASAFAMLRAECRGGGERLRGCETRRARTGHTSFSPPPPPSPVECETSSPPQQATPSADGAGSHTSTPCKAQGLTNLCSLPATAHDCTLALAIGLENGRTSFAFLSDLKLHHVLDWQKREYPNQNSDGKQIQVDDSPHSP